MSHWSILLACAALVTTPAAAQKPKPILIGIEYAYPGGAKTFARLGVPLAKLYPDSITWGDMQKGPGRPIDFAQMDRFVREYQQAGFKELVLVLKSQSRWASRNYLTNFAPKPEFMSEFEAWVRAVVERYDHDGKDDMPGLVRPVRFFEVGSEFSSFEPTPNDDYIAMLERAHKAARQANANVVLLHAAFIAPTVFRDDPKPDRYPAEFDRVQRRINIHGLAGMRQVLDHAKYTDMVNFHALTDPLEIEPTMKWLRYELKQRRLDKPIIVSDTMPNPLVGWGPATKLPPAKELPGLHTTGIVIPPATERDRPALADYFTKLLNGDADTIAWNHAFVAADMVKKVVIAAEQGAVLINTCFMEDLTLFKAKAFQAGAGTSAWAGMADTDLNILTQERTIKSLRPSFYAIQQLQRHIKDYTAVERVRNVDPKVRLYKFTKGGAAVWIAWHEPGRVYLPGAPLPSVPFRFMTTAKSVMVEPMIDRQGQTRAETTTIAVANGYAELTVSVQPVFVFRKE